MKYIVYYPPNRQGPYDTFEEAQRVRDLLVRHGFEYVNILEVKEDE